MNALLKFGMHLDYCPCYIPDGQWKDNHHYTKTEEDFVVRKLAGCFVWTLKCTCGFYEAQELK